MTTSTQPRPRPRTKNPGPSRLLAPRRARSLDSVSLELLDGLDAVTLDPTTFDHRAHVRVAWAALRDGPSLDAASARVERGLQALATGAGAPDKYDAELTRTWMRRVDEALGRCSSSSWDEFARVNPDLFAAPGQG